MKTFPGFCYGLLRKKLPVVLQENLLRTIFSPEMSKLNVPLAEFEFYRFRKLPYSRQVVLLYAAFFSDIFNV
ncbi:hypothetical protein [Chitinophaga varians]|uniref:hypothetical protein n=1 Tax=Chitinophaga varians TaxID=2202339 RepID=UPI00165FBFD8|nr:hypothetical protein [Chitinophaga varians]MBC9909603.1 hypothetical protein [Chitinophaga varians]